MVCSTGAGNQTALTVSKKNPYVPASVCTVTGKNSSNVTSVPGSLVRTIDTISFWSASTFEWNDLKGDGFLVDGANYFVVSLKDGAVAGNSKSVTCVWEEI